MTRNNFLGWGRRSAVAIAAVAAALLLGVPAAHAAPAAHRTLAPATASAVVPFATKSAVWPELHVGDCQQDNGTIVLSSDGTGTWSATTLTYQTHTGDVWHSSFDFYTTAGTHLFGVGTFDSPVMNDGNPPPRYNWTATFTYDPSLYFAVDLSKTIQHSSC
jgi:hypothetical protein